jgi:two-component system, sensor histidine kinase and response regulator
MNGFSAKVASDGIEALRLAKEETPALVITDIEMPGMGGFELLKNFHDDERLRTVPVIVISAKVDRAAIRRGMELGADDFITKPFTEDEVIHSIQMRLEKKDLIEELDSFAHTVAHDLRNPLGVLKGRLDILEIALGNADPKSLAMRQVAEARSAADRLQSIIEELLVLSGVRQQETVSRAIDMEAVVDEALLRLSEVIRKGGASVDRPEAWPVAVGHPPWVVHVWQNYISNAVKYAGPNAIISLGAGIRPDGAFVRFWVEDKGPGLDAVARAALFVPFTRISSIRLTGHGLGLSIVRRIVEKLGGVAGVDSEPGKGSRFWFDLPAAKGGAPGSEQGRSP